MIHNMVGGGGEKLFAIIAVTYPEGSVCTCTNGTKTLTARDTSGKALFNVPPGTWTVTATDGSKTKSVTVSITAEGQAESVTLRYELIIFEEGTGFANGITVKSKPGFITFDESSINITANMGIGYLNLDPIDVTGYNTIWVDAKAVSNAYGEPVVFGVGETAASAEASKSIAANSSRNTFSLDVSNLTGEKTLFLGTNSGGGTVYNWWLE